jgi:polysaccharide pyruvyl transferase WcaK-like protein/MoaA/NifB/PqqE/SkfB family radical SAM enzyme
MNAATHLSPSFAEIYSLLGWRGAGNLLAQLAPEWAGDWRSTIQAEKPHVLNFQVNDICNAKCVMCHIWKQKRDHELSPEEFETLIRNPFFAEVEHIGITGGEPTLRDDLPRFYEIALEVWPGLSGASFITNGFLTNKVVRLYSQVNEHYQQHGKVLAGMVSIDGVGIVHDRVRGVAGSFDKATQTLLGLREKGIPVIACCTIVKENVYGVHDLLQWGRDHGIYTRFRVGEFINRLYNLELTEQIRNFDPFERRHLVSFFHLLLAEYEIEEQVKRTYTSILSLLTGGTRSIKCPYQTSRSLNIDSHGRFAYCAPRGKPHPLGANAQASVRRHTLERVQIRLKHCSVCIHDYHAEWAEIPAWSIEQTLTCDQAMYAFTHSDFPAQELPAEQISLKALSRILLVGWYGTETAGDIAILAGILQEYLNENLRLQFVLFSLYPYYTRLTLQEMDPTLANHVTVLSYHGPLAWRASQTCQAVVMAGGPLMDIPETRLIACLFQIFRKQGKPCIVEGCGIGPLNVAEYRQNVIHIARLASRLRVRDQASRELLQSYGLRKTIEVREDPSRPYIRRSDIHYAGQSSTVIRCFLRELTYEYPQALTPEDATQRLLQFLKNLLAWYPEYRIELWAMHYFPIGNDDRRFAQQLATAISNDRLIVEHKPHLPQEILRAMADAQFCICMRFHSVVFAATIGAPFMAIDYTSGGKVWGFLADTQQLHRSSTLEHIAEIDKDSFRAMLREAGSV